MKYVRYLALPALAAVLWMTVAGTSPSADAPPAERRAALQKTLQAGNYKDAYEGYRQLALDPATDPKQVGGDLSQAIQCLRSLNRTDEVDEFREQVIAAHAGNWRLLQTAAESFQQMENHGFIVAGKFYRGNRRGGGHLVNAAQRDRVRALQLMVQATGKLKDEPDRQAVSQFYMSLAQMLLSNRGSNEAWRLQYLTDLSQLPDYDEGWGQGGGERGAPVDADGTPIYHRVPKSFETAQSDGERWRWALTQAAEAAPGRLNEVRWHLAQFHLQQFGVQTLAQYSAYFAAGLEDRPDDSGTYALHTLGENETIARLASGVKRFKLPDEFNPIRILQQIAAEPNGSYAAESLEALAEIFENRRQYPQAAEHWRKAIKQFGPGIDNSRQKRLEQIEGNVGRFDGHGVQPAGKGATVEYRFRNGKQVHFEAHEINVAKLLDDLKAYLKSNPQQLDGDKLNLHDLGYRLVTQQQKQYVGQRVAEWDLTLEPREKHFDKRVTVATPLQKAGAYLLSAKMSGGNTSLAVVWVADTVIAKKPLNGKTYYFVADAVTGQPVAKANVELFGYRQQHLGGNRFQVQTTNFAEFTDADGQLIADIKDANGNYQWIVTARDGKGRFAYLGFTGMWRASYYDQAYNQTKVFVITDRPVYRPNQSVKYKFWVRHAQYDQEDTSSFARQTFAVEIHNPKGEKVLARSFQADAYGGFDGEFELPSDATLGQYQIYIPALGGGQFRVEEYKKPEFEVTVSAPTEPVMLGEKVAATITAKYYFGAPVTQAKVKYKISRSTYQQTWYPVGDWDWFYGPGYWWFGYDYNWYPGWRNWGCSRPVGWWWGHSHQPPEIVADAEVEIGPDGTAKVEIDTALAKEIHGDRDHQYSITAEVVDASRRTIVGTGNVMVARQPFKVFAWVDRGYYRAGDTVLAQFSAHTLDQKPVPGKGKLKLFKIAYDAQQKPIETVVQTWDLDTNDRGTARQQFVAAAGGQYRLSYTVTDAAGHAIEGGYLLTVFGGGSDPGGFQFNELELVADQREYQPGDKVKLLINTNRVGSTVALFLRPTNGVYLPPKILRLKSKSTITEIDVAKKDMPNFFVEAMTISGGRLHDELKELVVPPEKRVLNVEVTPSRTTYKPGQPAKVQLKLTDFDGKPFVGSTALAVYDKSVEYISGGSNVEEIKAFFWKWRRSHHPQTESSLQRFFSNLVPPNGLAMNDLGVFGGSVADELSDGLSQLDAQATRYQSRNNLRGMMFGGMGAGGFGGGGGLAPMSAAAESAPMPTAAPAGAAANFAADKAVAGGEGGGGGATLVQPTIRSNFADTAFWAGALTTKADGTAEISLNMPESLTTWRVKAWGMGHGTKVGQGEVDVITSKDLLVRMQAPRFFVEKDEVVLSANVHNYLKSKKQVQVVLEADGDTIVLPADAVANIEIDAGDEARVDWRVKVVKEGQAKIRMKALTDEDSDALEMSFPVFVHGMLKTDSFAGVVRPDDTVGKFTIDVPAERRINESRLEIRYSPTLAGAMVDALPYMADYPYGCTEQTLNRFVPTVITQKILQQMGLDLKAIQAKRTNLNAQEIGDDRERAKGWKRFERNPVFDEAEVQSMVKEGVRRLTEMQLSDGGWGWFSGWGEHSSPHTTAVVVHGLQTAAQNDVALVPGVLERGVEWLKRHQDEQITRLNNAPEKKQPWKTKADDIDAFVYMVLVDAGVKSDAMRDFLYRDRTDLSVYTKAMFGLALHKQGEAEKLAMILQNISQFVVQDDENHTAWLKLPQGYWWYWYGSEHEAHAYYLKLLSKTEPKGVLASRLVKYLLNNRKHGTYWNSTRDTALCIEALADYFRASGEDKPDMTVEVWVDGRKYNEVKIDAANLFTFDNKLVLTGDAVETGKRQVELRKKGRGPLYFNAYLTNFTLEDHITKAGLEVKVDRKYYKLVPVDKKIKVEGARGQAVDQKVEKYERHELKNLDALKSGDLVEIELEIDSKNDYEYLVFEDMKAAGFEPVEVRSGYGGNALGAYLELRDERVSLFVRQLPRGKHSLSYRMRAEIPGRFSALPSRGYAMYAPELKANSEEIKLIVED